MLTRQGRRDSSPTQSTSKLELSITRQNQELIQNLNERSCVFLKTPHIFLGKFNIAAAAWLKCPCALLLDARIRKTTQMLEILIFRSSGKKKKRIGVFAPALTLSCTDKKLKKTYQKKRSDANSPDSPLVVARQPITQAGAPHPHPCGLTMMQASRMERQSVTTRVRFTASCLLSS